ncbi:hypothetical protein NPIL_582911 [Nephila pilipes]|uniref:Uncharacterized protein n=1 Tax=Nephila pilipes TaxID=299642 RepID=A0A8X6PD83_NEPPI|nr:hypothetical protein NPIL_582911 [Nephila pilipes]
MNDDISMRPYVAVMKNNSVSLDRTGILNVKSQSVQLKALKISNNGLVKKQDLRCCTTQSSNFWKDVLTFSLMQVVWKAKTNSWHLTLRCIAHFLSPVTIHVKNSLLHRESKETLVAIRRSH